jgi:hypothetical protein
LGGSSSSSNSWQDDTIWAVKDVPLEVKPGPAVLGGRPSWGSAVPGRRWDCLHDDRTLRRLIAVGPVLVYTMTIRVSIPGQEER